MNSNKQLARQLDKTDQVDRYRMILLGQLKGRTKEQLAITRINAIWELLRNGYSRTDVIKYCINQYQLSQAQCYRLLTLTEKVYGEISTTSKESKRAILSEVFHRILNKQLAAGDLFEASVTADKIAKLHGLYDPDKEAQDSVVLPVIVLSSDPRIIEEQQTIEINDGQDIPQP